MTQALEALTRARNTAMQQTLTARIPECGEFAGIAQDLDFAITALAQEQGWRTIDSAPMDGRKIILAYMNRNGLKRTVMGHWLTDEAAAEIDHEGAGLEGGWYEQIDNWDDYSEVRIYEGEPTHWMPLPPPPEGEKE